MVKRNRYGICSNDPENCSLSFVKTHKKQKFDLLEKDLICKDCKLPLEEVFPTEIPWKMISASIFLVLLSLLVISYFVWFRNTPKPVESSGKPQVEKNENAEMAKISKSLDSLNTIINQTPDLYRSKDIVKIYQELQKLKIAYSQLNDRNAEIEQRLDQLINIIKGIVERKFR